MTAMTIDIVEALELPVEKYEAFLRKHKIYEAVEKMSRNLMFPRASPKQDLIKVWERISNLSTPVVFPVSAGPEYNPHEHMFGLQGPIEGAPSATRRAQPQTQSLIPVVQRPPHHVSGSALWVKRARTTTPGQRRRER